jgi:hypothetical protein
MSRDPNPHAPYQVGDEVCSIALPFCYGTVVKTFPNGGGGYRVKADPQMNHFTDGFYICHDECRLQVEVEAEEAQEALAEAETRWNQATERMKELREYTNELRAAYYEALGRSNDADRDLKNYTTPVSLGDT